MIQRHITDDLMGSLQDTPAVFLQGARQTGKSTLVQSLPALGHAADYLTSDDATVLAAVHTDPSGFINGLGESVILDEVQRVPALFLAIKAAIDRDHRPGRFILTGSANVLLLPKVSQALFGRMELPTLWPFSQGELEGLHDGFVDAVFRARLPRLAPPKLASSELMARALLGGFPEIVGRKSESGQKAWFGSYTTTILQRDVRDLSKIEGLGELPRLLGLLASRTCQLLNYSDLASSLSIPQSGLQRYLALLEGTFLVQRLPAWFSNIGKRLAKSPKLLLCDTGLATSLLGPNRRGLESSPELRGHLLPMTPSLSGWPRQKEPSASHRTGNSSTSFPGLLYL